MNTTQKPLPILTADEATELFRKPPQSHIDVGDGKIAYRCVGTGPDVLFVHGWPVTGATYRGLLPYLVPHVTCHIIDLVGAGDSVFDRSTQLGLGLHIESVKRVVDKLQLNDVALVGHDSGGLIARHAMAGDRRLRSMVLVDTEQPQGLTWLFKQFLLMAKLPCFEHILAWTMMKRGLRKSRFVLGGCFADATLLDGEFQELFLEPLQRDRERRWAAGELARRFDQNYVHELSEVHKNIDVPVKLVWGGEDPFFPIKQTREMVKTFPDASLFILPKARFFSHEEFPKEVASAILPTLLGKATQDLETI